MTYREFLQNNRLKKPDYKRFRFRNGVDCVGSPFANWNLACNSNFGGGKQMSDEELIMQYNQKFWELVDDKGCSYRKARRILKKKYPGVYYDVQKGKWFINDRVYRLEEDK